MQTQGWKGGRKIHKFDVHPNLLTIYLLLVEPGGRTRDVGNKVLLKCSNDL